jgi:prepilin-type N-terminal cleavage/methylation domain-containing protein
MIDEISNREHGFTLVELMAVVAIIAIFATIAIPRYKGYINKAKITVANSTLGHIRKSLELNNVERQDGYPTTIDFSTCLDGGGVVIFEPLLCDRIKQDFFVIDSYLVIDGIYTLKVRAKDTNHTPLTLTKSTITVGP